MRDFVELGLKRSRRSGTPTSHRDLLVAVDRLLGSLVDLASTLFEAEPGVTSTFVHRIDACRRILKNEESGRTMSEALDTAIRTIEHFLKSARRYVAARETELTEMIRILHEAATLMAGRSTSFTAELLATSERLQSFVQLSDIRELKHQLTAEVEALRRAVEEKQRRDAESSARLTERLAVLQTKLDRAEEEAALDPLTRVANRGSFDQTLLRMIDNARATRRPLSLAMIDVDDFKGINDAHGHPIGDRVLLCAAMWLGRGLRQSDVLARYGGDEFAIVFKEARLAEVDGRLTQILAEIAARSFEYEEEGQTRTVRFTASAGAAELHASDDPEQLLKRADEALYDAKRGGKNRVVVRRRSIFASFL